jgi:hypothetical protein
LQIETTDLRELAKFAGGNPKTFYRGARLEGVDISGQDLRGMEFTDLQAAKIKFDKRTKLDRRYIKAISPKKVQNELASGATPQSFRDEAWAEKWLLQWARLSRNADREPLFDEGETLLRLHPTDQNWPRVWHAIWLQERRDSSRRKRLQELALSRIPQADNDRLSWLIVFRRVWKNSSHQERELLKPFMQDGLQWLARQDIADPAWYQAWVEFSTASRVSRIGSEFLFRLGLNWLQRQSINHARWSLVWKKLWGSGVADQVHGPLLKSMGMDWLNRVDRRAVGWGTVWRRLWRYSQRRDEDVQELLRNVEWWLDTHREDPGWANVWQELHRHPAVAGKDWVTTAALAWLKTNRKSDRWVSVWRHLRERAPPSEREQLNKIGRDWLREQPKSNHWAELWLEIWNLSDHQLDDEFRLDAENWLRKNKKSSFQNVIANIISERSSS